MGYFTDYGLNAMLNGSGFAGTATYAGLLVAAAAKTGTATASTDVISSTSHGYSNGDVVIFTTLTGGSGLTLNRPYYVVNQATSTFQVAKSAGGTVVDITSDYSTINVKKLTEVSGGSPAYARKGLTWTTAAAGTIGISSTYAFDVPAGTVDAVGFYNASSSGTLLAGHVGTQEVFGAQGTYTLTSAPMTLTS